MRLLKIIIVAVVAAGVLGPSAYFFYDALHPYRHLPAAPRTVYVHPMVPANEKARQLRLYPRREERKAARQLLGVTVIRPRR